MTVCSDQVAKTTETDGPSHRRIFNQKNTSAFAFEMNRLPWKN